MSMSKQTKQIGEIGTVTAILPTLSYRRAHHPPGWRHHVLALLRCPQRLCSTPTGCHHVGHSIFELPAAVRPKRLCQPPQGVVLRLSALGDHPATGREARGNSVVAPQTVLPAASICCLVFQAWYFRLQQSEEGGILHNASSPQAGAQRCRESSAVTALEGPDGSSQWPGGPVRP